LSNFAFAQGAACSQIVTGLRTCITLLLMSAPHPGANIAHNIHDTLLASSCIGAYSFGGWGSVAVFNLRPAPCAPKSYLYITRKPTYSPREEVLETQNTASFVICTVPNVEKLHKRTLGVIDDSKLYPTRQLTYLTC
jgi:hypothetical protein